MKKCKGGCQMRAGGKTCMKCGCDMEDDDYEKEEKGEKEMRSGGMACMKCGGKMHKSGGTVSSCMKCGGGKYTFGGKVNWSKKKVTSKYASGGMIKRADGSYSQRGLWDNIRDNAGSGKKPTKQMLDQEKKIKSEHKQYIGGGEVFDAANELVIKGAKRIANVANNISKNLIDSKYTKTTPSGNKYYIDEEGFPVVNIPDSEIPYDEEGKYDDQLMVKSEKVANTLGSEKQSKGSNTQLDYSLPNWGYAKMEQKKLNDLIQAEIKAGAKDLELLEEDDIIGEKTLAAMNKFEGKGYARPEGFKDKWLKKYAEDYARGVRMQVPGVTAPITPKVPGKETVKTTTVKAEDDSNKDYTKEDMLSDMYDMGKGALEYLFPGVKNIKTTRITKSKTKETPKKEEQKSKPKESGSSFYLPSISDVMSGVQGAFDYTGKALGNFIETAGEFVEKYQDKKEVPGYIKNAKGELISPELNKRLKEKYNARKAKEDEESKKRMGMLKSDLQSGYNFAKQLGSDIYSGIGNAFEYAINLGKMGEELKQQESARSNFGKRSAKASAEAAERYAKIPKYTESYTPSMFSIAQPEVLTSKKENLPVKTQGDQTAETFTSIKDFLFANKAEDKKKTIAELTSKNEYKKRIYEEAKTIMKLDLKPQNTKEDIKYNYNSIDKHIDKINKALDMLSGPTVTTDRGFQEMTTKMVKKAGTPVGQKYKNLPQTNEYESIQTVNDEEYDKLVVLKTYLDKELDKIYRDPKYKNLDETDKKAVLTRYLFNKRKELANKQEQLKKQIR